MTDFGRKLAGGAGAGKWAPDGSGTATIPNTAMDTGLGIVTRPKYNDDGSGGVRAEVAPKADDPIVSTKFKDMQRKAEQRRAESGQSGQSGQAPAPAPPQRSIPLTPVASNPMRKMTDDELRAEANKLMAQIDAQKKAWAAAGPAVKVAERGSPENGYKTQLTMAAQPAYEAWKGRVAPGDSGEDYDYAGAFAAGEGRGPEGHMTDRFKMPNHPTFSVESDYAKHAPDKAGSWRGETYVPPVAQSTDRGGTGMSGSVRPQMGNQVAPVDLGEIDSPQKTHPLDLPGQIQNAADWIGPADPNSRAARFGKRIVDAKDNLHNKIEGSNWGKAANQKLSDFENWIAGPGTVMDRTMSGLLHKPDKQEREFRKKMDDLDRDIGIVKKYQKKDQ